MARVGRPRKIGRPRTGCGQLRRKERFSRSMFLHALIGDNAAIYIMEAGGAVKVGISNDPEMRRNQIQNGNDRPVRLTWWAWLPEAQAIETEREIHKRLRETCNHAVGEWYYMDAHTAFAFIVRTLCDIRFDYWDDEMFRMLPWEWNEKINARNAAVNAGEPL